MAPTSSDQRLASGLQIYNPLPNNINKFFLNFSQLPTNLRCDIWEHALSYERLLHVKLYKPYPTGDKTEKRKRYIIVLLGPFPISKLFRANQESRHMALRFYRVHMPCRYRWKHVEKSGTLYFNPEFDIIKLDPDSDAFDWSHSLISRPNYFADFAHQLWLKDPRRVGLVNFALENLWPAEINWELRLGQKANVSQLRDGLQRLRCVYFICCADLRLVSIWCHRMPELVAAKSIYLQEHPAMIYRNTFDRLPHDPRPVDLRAVQMGSEDPLKQVQGWFSMLSRLQVPTRDPPVAYRCMVTRQPTPRATIKDRDTALKWINDKRKCFQGESSGKSPNFLRDLRQESQPAFGFWVFPIECLEREHDVEGDASRLGQNAELDRILDLSSFKPELCLFQNVRE
ncbi:hypothetical protein CEP54_013249 [Fusarium duplospermum]|uniref:2EXR domain-containing protein n=1 Tax=Fusarium duplospermum TaxID=1325734 RepID=A0A428P3X8_9HYPO|nr:hypothetical protein CEP54_013249 [Fusarium duplospermum]